MIYEISEYKLESLLKAACKAGASQVLTEVGPKKGHISQRQAFSRFGETRIMRWRKEGKIVPIKNGGKIYYDLNDLDRLKSINELYTQINTPEILE